MRLNTDDISTSGKTISHIRVDRIGGASGLWWVAEEFTDGSTKPEGMFPDKDAALDLADELSRQWGVALRVNAA